MIQRARGLHYSVRRLIAVSGLILSFISPAFCAGIAGRPGELFNFGAGARSLGMGSAATAVVNDVTSVYYNPAGLGLLPAREVVFMRAVLYEGANYDYLGYAQNKSKTAGGWGLEFIRLGIQGAEGRDEFNNPTGGFGYSETAFSFASGWRGVLHPNMSLGVRGKLLQRSLAGSSDRLIGVDFGAQAGPWMGERLTLGAVASNVVGLKTGDTDDKLPTLLRVGAAYKVVGPLSIAGDFSNDGEFRLGTEYAFGMVAVRLGMADQGLSFGGGLVFKNRYRMDLAVLSHPSLGMSQRISLGYRFGTVTPAATKGRKMQFFAGQFLGQAQAALKKRDYLKASLALETGIGIDPKLGGGEWRAKAERLRIVVKKMDLEAHPEEADALSQETEAAYIAYAALDAYLSREEDRAVLLAHAASGQEPSKGAYRHLLDALAGLSGKPVDRDLLLPPGRLAELKMKKAVDAVYARRFEGAIVLLREALWLDPENAAAWTKLGSAYFAVNDKTRAAEAYRKALELAPADAKLKEFMSAQGMKQ